MFLSAVFFQLIKNIDDFHTDYQYTRLFAIIIVNLLEALFNSSKLQGSPGKYFLKMKVINVDGSRISFSKALVRILLTNFFYTISCLFDSAFSLILLIIDTIINSVSALLLIRTKQKTALHDILCNTRVVACDSNGNIIKLEHLKNSINNIDNENYS
jgi:uncharacterized RDD family membrane protein YckC